MPVDGGLGQRPVVVFRFLFDVYDFRRANIQDGV